MPDDLALVVPLEVLVSVLEELPVVVQIPRPLGTGVLVSEVTKRALGNVNDLEALAIDLERITNLCVGVTTVDLSHVPGEGVLLHPLTREQRPGVDLGHSSRSGLRGEILPPASLGSPTLSPHDAVGSVNLLVGLLERQFAE